MKTMTPIPSKKHKRTKRSWIRNIPIIIPQPIVVVENHRICAYPKKWKTTTNTAVPIIISNRGIIIYNNIPTMKPIDPYHPPARLLRGYGVPSRGHRHPYRPRRPWWPILWLPLSNKGGDGGNNNHHLMVIVLWLLLDSWDHPKGT